MKTSCIKHRAAALSCGWFLDIARDWLSQFNMYYKIDLSLTADALRSSGLKHHTQELIPIWTFFKWQPHARFCAIKFIDWKLIKFRISMRSKERTLRHFTPREQTSKPNKSTNRNSHSNHLAFFFAFKV